MITTATASPTRSAGPRRMLPGLVAALLIGVVASAIGGLVPVIGAPVVGMLLGVGIRTWADRRDARQPDGRPGQVGARLAPGAGFAGRYLLQAAIVALGAGLSVRAVLHIGVTSLPVLLGTLALCLAAAWLLGRLLRIPDPLRTLIGAGTGICGASAIAAIGPVVEADALSMAYAVGTIVAYNICAVLLFPALGHLMHLSQRQFGLWAGTAVNDTSSVVATGYAYGTTAGQYAVTVKLTRALMIIPVVLGLVALRGRRPSADAGGAGGAAGVGGTAEAGGAEAKAHRPAAHRLVPPFLVLFLLAATANSVGLVPAGGQPALARLAAFLVAVALGGIGLGVRLGELRRAGLRPLLFGGMLSAIVAISSLGLQALTGT